jgi:hypothetical protein
MATNDSTIRQFQVGFPEAELTDLRRRVNAARWPERETVSDDSQGVRLAMMQELAHGTAATLLRRDARQLQITALTRHRRSAHQLSVADRQTRLHRLGPRPVHPAIGRSLP